MANVNGSSQLIFNTMLYLETISSKKKEEEEEGVWGGGGGGVIGSIFTLFIKKEAMMLSTIIKRLSNLPSLD